MITADFMHRWRGFIADCRAMVLVEMAMTMPIVIVIALGGFEVARYTLLQQKLDRLSVTVADLVSQSTSISTTQLTQIFAATAIESARLLRSEVSFAASVSPLR